MSRFLYQTPWLLGKIYPALTWKVPVNEKKIYLTFDDGPVPEATDFVLDILKEFKAKATFFCVGENIRKYPDLFRRILAEGHSTGNHTFNHLNGWKTSDQRYIDNIKICQQEMDNMMPEKSVLFRPPYGRITRSQIRQIQFQFKIVMWSLLTGDYDLSQTKEDCLRISQKLSAKGSILVFHDSLKTLQKLEYVLPELLSSLARQQFKLDSLPYTLN